jgi:acetyl esterase/lipase
MKLRTLLGGIGAVFGTLLFGMQAHAQHRGVLMPLDRPYSDPAAIPLYAVPPPGGPDPASPEIWMTAPNDLVARNVTVPTITPVLPARGTASGAAAIVLPGGGNVVIAMQKEGYDVARFLAGQGIAAFVVKYRLQATPADIGEMRARIAAAPTPPPAVTVGGSPVGIADTREAMRWVKAHATEYGIDPARIGLVGFSAGAGNAWGLIGPGDDAMRPAFAALFYGGLQARPELPAAPPPLFLAAAADDVVVPRQPGMPLVDQWIKAGGKVEFHLYQTGGHGFGGFRQGATSDLAMEELVLWLKANGLLGRRN